MKKFSQKPGVSLIIAMIFVSALMLVMADLAQVQLNIIKDVGMYNADGKSLYLMRGVKEMANFWAATNGEGANVSDPANLQKILVKMAMEIGVANCEDIDGSQQGKQPCVHLEVKGRATDADRVELWGVKYYSVPVKGTGTAGTDCDKFGAHNLADANDPCNWNKLSPLAGESVEIPLYYKDPAVNGGVIQKLNLAGVNQFKIRVRAPLCDAKMKARNPNLQCDMNKRVVLYPKIEPNPCDPGINPGCGSYRNVKKDKVLIHWLITDYGVEPPVTLEARAVREADDKRWRHDPRQDAIFDTFVSEFNTEFSAGRINLANQNQNGNIVLSKEYYGHDLRDDLEDGTSTALFISRAVQPILRLSLIDRPLMDDGDPTVPQETSTNKFNVKYLEYQILTTGAPIADAKSALTGWAIVGDYQKYVKSYRWRQPSLSGFVLESM